VNALIIAVGGFLGDGVEDIGPGGGSRHASDHIPITEYVKPPG
jgi:hypothetical protein